MGGVRGWGGRESRLGAHLDQQLADLQLPSDRRFRQRRVALWVLAVNLGTDQRRAEAFLNPVCHGLGADVHLAVEGRPAGGASVAVSLTVGADFDRSPPNAQPARRAHARRARRVRATSDRCLLPSPVPPLLTLRPASGPGFGARLHGAGLGSRRGAGVGGFVGGFGGRVGGFVGSFAGGFSAVFCHSLDKGQLLLPLRRLLLSLLALLLPHAPLLRQGRGMRAGRTVVQTTPPWCAPTPANALARPARQDQHR